MNSATSTDFDTTLIAEHLTTGARLLTANHRLTRTLLSAWGKSVAEESVWEVPAISSLESWLETCWQRLLDRQYQPTLNGTVISPQQERLLWQQIIRDHCDLPAAALAQQAQQAYQIVQQWRIDTTLLDPPLTSWVEVFRQRMASLEMITASERTAIILGAFAEGVLPQERRLLLLGFQSLSPLEEALLNAATEDLVRLQLPSHNHSRQRVACNDRETELTAAATWAKTQLQQHPELRIGIVVPQLTSNWRQAERIFRSHFEPAHWSPEQPDSAPQQYNISAGIPLTEAPLIAAAFELLALNKANLPLAHFRNILYSPFWGSGDALQVRATADRYLAEQGDPAPSCSELRFQLRRAEEGSESALATKLDAIASLQRKTPAKASFPYWVNHFVEQLQILGWPGYRTLSSTEYQQQQHWRQLLEGAHQYAQILGEISAQAALNQLQQLANTIVFQAESPAANVQVLGLLESAAIYFDKLWVTGLDDTQWPAPTRLNPLLPVALQQQLATPRASPQQELRIAENSLRDLTACAGEIIFSHSRRDGERELHVSALLGDIPEMPVENLASTLGYPFQPPQFVGLELLEDNHGPSLAASGETPSGGTALFADQALCPFNSFARHRLGARLPPEPTLGLSPLDRGNILHTALEYLWRELGDHRTLMETSDPAPLVEEIIKKTLQEFKNKRKNLFGPRFFRIESQRLKRLLLNWLALEKQRLPFQVQALEQHSESAFAGIPLKLRIDRIDTDSDGRAILIDYKTGSASIASWLEERPSQPQLPLYALSCAAPPAAICFGLINANQCGFKGIGASAELLPGIQPFGAKGIPESDALMEHWHTALTQLATEINRGYAAVSFAKPADALKQSELLPLNRWYQQEQQ